MTHEEKIEVLNQHTDEAHFVSLPSAGFVNDLDVEYVEAAHYDRETMISQVVPTDAPATGVSTAPHEMEIA